MYLPSNKRTEATAIKDWFERHRNDGYSLYAVTITYKPRRSGLDHTPEQINKIFHKTYFEKFLGKHLLRNNHWQSKLKAIQPYAMCFVEEHEAKAVATKTGYIFPSRLHHHVILAVHPATKSQMDKFLGEDTLLGLHPGIATTKVERADANWTLYSTKAYRAYEEHFKAYGPPGELVASRALPLC